MQPETFVPGGVELCTLHGFDLSAWGSGRLRVYGILEKEMEMGVYRVWGLGFRFGVGLFGDNIGVIEV